MTILSCEQLREFDGESEVVEGDGPTKRRYVVPYLLKTSTHADHFQTIAAWFDANRFAAGATYALGNDVDLSAFAHRLTGRRRPEQPLWWDLELEFETRNQSDEEEKDDGSPTDDPLEARLKIEVDAQQETVPVKKAIYRSGFADEFSGAGVFVAAGDRFPIVNSAVDRVTDPAPERDDEYPIYRLTRNFEEWDAAEWRKWRNAVNSVFVSLDMPALGLVGVDCEPYTLRVLAIRTTGVAFANRTRYWPVELLLGHLDELDENDDPVRTWRHVELDRGLRRSAEAGAPNGRGGTFTNSDVPTGVPKLVVGEDLEGNPFDEPVLLDGKGQPLGAGLDPIEIVWSKYPEKDLLPLINLFIQD